MKLYIKNMVCSRCKMVVKSALESLGHSLLTVDLGEVELRMPVTDDAKKVIAEQLKEFGFEIIDDKKSRTIAKIKTLIIALVHHQNLPLKTNLSDYLSQELHQDYSTLSNLFSEVTATTIEQFYIHQKIEKVKELLLYDEISLSEIADSLNYSNVAHLSNQFKKVTGFSPTHFKNLKVVKRKQIEDL
ncbi:AraC family transcriptional regulator [Flavobacterium sp. UBA6135]|uniref:AraC family transcriptional regulator n=1 Tax=Flavobacterium sp. UBA6135 TaxID=1946553 RepID=UPI0025C56290|nr:AraC family transcriptional regulator [Flavobacterium sp. UBA6135]